MFCTGFPFEKIQFMDTWLRSVYIKILGQQKCFIFKQKNVTNYKFYLTKNILLERKNLNQILENIYFLTFEFAWLDF